MLNLVLTEGDKLTLIYNKVIVQVVAIPGMGIRFFPPGGGIKAPKALHRPASFLVRITDADGNPQKLDERIETTLLEIEPKEATNGSE